jgi:hypothetical protein
MKEIPLSRGKVALVDDEDYDAISAFVWHLGQGGYACRHQPDERIQAKRKRYLQGMHRMIMGLGYGDPRRIDHKNGDTLDNRRDNLRICSQSENGYNRGAQRNNTSGYKGVVWNKGRNKWTAHITYLGKAMNLGGFDDPKQAFTAYVTAAKILHGEFAYSGDVPRIEIRLADAYYKKIGLAMMSDEQAQMSVERMEGAR